MFNLLVLLILKYIPFQKLSSQSQSIISTQYLYFSIFKGMIIFNIHPFFHDRAFRPFFKKKKKTKRKCEVVQACILERISQDELFPDMSLSLCNTGVC